MCPASSWSAAMLSPPASPTELQKCPVWIGSSVHAGGRPWPDAVIVNGKTDLLPDIWKENLAIDDLSFGVKASNSSMNLNIGRGLFRAWVAITVLWLLAGAAIGYAGITREIVGGQYQAAGHIRGGKAASKVDWNLPFYDVIRSPSREHLNVAFQLVDYRRHHEWETNDRVVAVNFPDHSRLYIQIGYDAADRTYIGEQFWEQRWRRWGKTAATVTAIMIVPPALLFLIGYVLLWIGRGFVSR